jgi:hypothetical protein
LSNGSRAVLGGLTGGVAGIAGLIVLACISVFAALFGGRTSSVLGVVTTTYTEGTVGGFDIEVAWGRAIIAAVLLPIVVGALLAAVPHLRRSRNRD